MPTETLSAVNPVETLLQIAGEYALPRCLHVVADLGIADALDDQPRTAAALAESTGTNADALNRVLRLLSCHGIFENKNGKFAHTDASRLSAQRSSAVHAVLCAHDGNADELGCLRKTGLHAANRPAGHVSSSPWRLLELLC